MREIKKVGGSEKRSLGERKSGSPLKYKSLRVRVFGCSFEDVEFCVTVGASMHD